jgi:hypothetical protein
MGFAKTLRLKKMLLQELPEENILFEEESRLRACGLRHTNAQARL